LLTNKAEKLKKIVSHKFADLDFRIFELLQLNDFFNHQIAHNVFFLYVESDLGDFVFDLLRDKYPGKILISPSLTDIEKYVVDAIIIIEKLVSEAPKDKNIKSNMILEQLLVDLICDKIMRSLINIDEIPRVINSILNKYVIDQAKMFRYSRRRNVEKQLKMIVESYIEG
jgi:hypothetical protein